MAKETDRYSQMFGGLNPSKGAQSIVVQALALGLDPSPITSKAGDAAKKEGRKKVGFYGEGGRYIDGLRQAVESEKWKQEQQARLNKSRPR